MIGVELVKSSIDKIINPSDVEFSLALVGVLVGSMGLKQWMAHLNHVLGEKIKSETLLATAQDSKNDVLATGAVLICAIFARITGINLDAWRASQWAPISVGAASSSSATRSIRYLDKHPTLSLFSISDQKS